MNITFPYFLRDFLKKFSDTSIDEAIENFSMELATGTTLTFSVVDPDVLYIQCNFKQVDADQCDTTSFYETLLNENGIDDRKIAPLYWSIEDPQTLTCSGYLFLDEENTENELLGILSILCSNELIEEIQQRCISHNQDSKFSSVACMPAV